MHAAGRVRHREEVVLNVYDIAAGWNQWAAPTGLGIWHSGLQVYGTEYTFSNDGVFSHQPRAPPGASLPSSSTTGEGACTFRVGIVLGTLDGMTRKDVEDVVRDTRSAFQAGTYSLVQQNCNHFASALARALLGDDRASKAIPGWVNRVAFVGQCCSCLLPAEVRGANQTRTTAAPSTMRSSKFQGNGQRLGGSPAKDARSSSQPSRLDSAAAAERRARVAAAAEARWKAARQKHKRQNTDAGN